AAWIRARATAEAIKSECYKFAARAGDYATAGAADLFREPRDKTIEAATRAGLTPVSDPAKVDDRRPSEPVTPEWYFQHRLREQKSFYAERQTKNEDWARWLRQASLAAAVLAAVVGGASSTF